MFEQLTQYREIGLMVLRLAVAVVFIYHALPKLKNAKNISPMIGLPTEAILALGAVEFLSSVGLVLGIYTQLSALLLGIIMIGAIYFKTMKWRVPFAAVDKTGWEFDFTLLAANIAILVS